MMPIQALPRPSIPLAEYGGRRRRLADEAAARGLDGVLVWAKGGANYDLFGDVFYLTNHYDPFPYVPDLLPVWSGRSGSALVLRSDGTGVLCVDSPEWRRDLVAIDEVRYDPHLYRLATLEMQDAGLGAGRVGLAGAEAMPAAAYRFISTQLPNVEFVDLGDVVADLRSRKSASEIALLRRSAAVGTGILRAVLDGAEPGRTDGDCAAAGLGVVARIPGAALWDISMASGPHSENFQWSRMPQWDAERSYQHGDIIHPDAYGVVDGYIFDLSRSKVIGGKVSPQQRRLIEGAAGCVGAVVDSLRPGITCGELHFIGRRFLEEEGFREPSSLDSSFPALGHHDGLGFESPWIMADGPDADKQIVAPAILSIEVEVADGGSAAGFEDMVFVDVDGTVEVLTADLPVFS